MKRATNSSPYRPDDADEKQQSGFNVQDLLGESVANESVAVSSVPISVVVSTGGGDGWADGIPLDT